MSRSASDLAIEQLFHDCGIPTWEQTRRRYRTGRGIRIILLMLSALVLGLACAWLAPGLLHAIRNGASAASLLRQSVARVGRS